MTNFQLKQLDFHRSGDRSHYLKHKITLTYLIAVSEQFTVYKKKKKKKSYQIILPLSLVNKPILADKFTFPNDSVVQTKPLETVSVVILNSDVTVLKAISPNTGHFVTTLVGVSPFTLCRRNFKTSRCHTIFMFILRSIQNVWHGQYEIEGVCSYYPLKIQYKN